MRPTLQVAFLSALLVSATSAFAQRGGHAGGFSGGHVGGSVGHFGGGFSGGSFGHSSGFAPRSFTSGPRFTSIAPTHAFVPSYRPPYRGPVVDRRREGDHYGRYRSPYRGYGGYPYIYANSWQLLPWDLGYSDYGGYNDYDSGPDAAQQPMATVAPENDGYRPDYGDPGYAQPMYQDAPSIAGNSVADEPELTLVFADGHRESIRNYVLTSNAVIVLDQAASGHQQHIPLATLDLNATEEAAQQAGLDFTPPA
jgi:hypothetical protein